MTNLGLILNKIYKVLTIALGVIWGLFAITFILYGVTKKFVYPLEYKELVIEIADSYGLDRALVFATIRVESSFDKNAQSKKGAKGLMQITDRTAEFIAKAHGLEEYDIFNERVNITFGCYYLKYLYDRFSLLETVLTAYNAGEGTVRGWLNDKELTDDGIALKEIPYKETREYVKKIVKSFEKYKKLYGNILDKRQIKG